MIFYRALRICSEQAQGETGENNAFPKDFSRETGPHISRTCQIVINYPLRRTTQSKQKRNWPRVPTHPSVSRSRGTLFWPKVPRISSLEGGQWANARLTL
ncbi:hypothetical protein TNCT_430391 [Trichonephila clavata]|uniref:Uncharacterized protein n=1 Tax=Trichonephila clavata TaxID=2740835 RepID=A0A8X6IMW7_TRICU|nr:hypothetical protein TNCT_430391 [Trichonephila clavata]